MHEACLEVIFFTPCFANYFNSNRRTIRQIFDGLSSKQRDFSVSLAVQGLVWRASVYRLRGGGSDGPLASMAPNLDGGMLLTGLEKAGIWLDACELPPKRRSSNTRLRGIGVRSAWRDTKSGAAAPLTGV